MGRCNETISTDRISAMAGTAVRQLATCSDVGVRKGDSKNHYRHDLKLLCASGLDPR